MAIVNYIPKKITVLDKRNSEGGYYEAVCDNCGRTFYPKSSKAKFCCTDCRNKDYVKRHPAPNKQKKVISRPERPIPEALRTIKSNSVTFVGLKKVINYLKEREATEMKGNVTYYREVLHEITVGELYQVGKHTVIRISSSKFEVKRSS